MEAKKILRYIRSEKRRQKYTLSLIASESYMYPDALVIGKYPLSNKYSEGYPGKRFYSGCKWIDKMEVMALDAAKSLFNCNYANVQCYSGSIANLAIYKALIKPGDTILSMEMTSGGHLSHSSKFSYVSHYYKVETYTVNEGTWLLDYEEIRTIALIKRPKLIIAGGSSYPYKINFAEFRKIADEVGAYLLADICHLSGLIVAGLHQHCFPYAHVAMCTTHKQLRGYRGALILWNNDELTTLINKSVFPGVQGGMNPSGIATNAYCLTRDLEPQYREYMCRVVENAKIMSECFRDLGVKVIGTETHMFLIDTVESFQITGNKATDLLERVGFLTNPNLIPFDTEIPSVASGIRLGTLYLSVLDPTRDEIKWIVGMIYQVLKSKDKALMGMIREELRVWLKNKNIKSDAE